MERKMAKAQSEVVESEEKRKHWLDERREEGEGGDDDGEGLRLFSGA